MSIHYKIIKILIITAYLPSLLRNAQEFSRSRSNIEADQIQFL